jgi:excinuclease ABC subunit B
MEHGITPRTVRKSIEEIMLQTSVLDIKGYDASHPYATQDNQSPLAAEEDVATYSLADKKRLISQTKKAMEKAAKNLDFMEAARLRDLLKTLEKD